MFIAASFTKMQNWNQSRCSSSDEWVSKCYSINTVEYYSEIKENELLIQAVTGVNLWGIMLSEKKPNPKCCKPYDSISYNILEMTKLGNGEQLSDGGGAEEGRFDNKRATEEILVVVDKIVCS